MRHTAVGIWYAIGAMAFLAGCAYFNSPDIKRGDQHLAAGNWEEASLAYKQALKDDPFSPTLQSKYTMARERAAASYEEHWMEKAAHSRFIQTRLTFQARMVSPPGNEPFTPGACRSI